MNYGVKTSRQARFQPCQRQGHVARQQSTTAPHISQNTTTTTNDDINSILKSRMAGIGLVSTIVVQSLLVWSAQAGTSEELSRSRLDDTNNEYIQKLLEKSERLREERREERLQHYYKKNFSEYFEFSTGDVSRELQDQIDQWKEKAASIE